MIFQSTDTTTTVTITRHELAALVAIASKDATRYAINGVLFDASARAAVSTDGHRLLVAVAGPRPFESIPTLPRESCAEHGQRNAAARVEHDEAQAAELVTAERRTLIASRVELGALLKSAGKAPIVISWTPGTAGGEVDGQHTDGTPTKAHAEAGGATWPIAPGSASFPPWRQVLPSVPTMTTERIAVNPAYLADAGAVLGKICETVTIWPGVDALAPLAISAESRAELDGVDVRWCYVLMPKNDGPGVQPWDLGTATKPAHRPKPAAVDATAEAAPAKRKRAA